VDPRVDAADSGRLSYRVEIEIHFHNDSCLKFSFSKTGGGFLNVASLYRNLA
jgi:hypothetical protein